MSDIDTLEQIATRDADLAKAANTTVELDPELSANVISGLTYAFEAVLFINGNATADFDCELIAPAGSTGGTFVNGTGAVTDIDTEINLTADGNDQILTLHGRFTAGDDGVAGIGWAQEVSNAGDTVVQAGSYFRLFNAT